jgi:hypothetical protein
MIDDFSRGWHDWYRLEWWNPHHWVATTRKVKDPKWRGPDGARLVFEIQSQTDNTLVLKFGCNAWGAFAPGKPAVDYTVVKHLKASPDWQTIAVSLDELAATDLKTTAPLANWQTVTVFTISPSGEIVQAGQKQKVDGKPWRGPREIRNLRWEGGRPVDGNIPEASPLSARSANGGAAGSVTISQSSSNTASSSSPRCPPKNDPGATSPLTPGAESRQFKHDESGEDQG